MGGEKENLTFFTLQFYELERALSKAPGRIDPMTHSEFKTLKFAQQTHLSSGRRPSDRLYAISLFHIGSFFLRNLILRSGGSFMRIISVLILLHFFHCFTAARTARYVCYFQ